MDTSQHRQRRHSRTVGGGGGRGPALVRLAAVALLAALLGVVSLGLHGASAACSAGKSADGICDVFTAGSVREGGSFSFTVPLPEQWAALSGGSVSFDDHAHEDVDARYGVELAASRDGFVYASKCNAPHRVVLLDDPTGVTSSTIGGTPMPRGENPDFSSLTASGRRITVRTRTGIWSESRNPAQIRYEIHGRQTFRTVDNGRVTHSSTEDCVVTGRSSGYGNPIVATAIAEITITRDTSSSASNPALTLAREHRPGTQRSNSHTPGAYVPPNTSRCTVVDVGSGQMSWCGTFITDGVEYAPDGTPLSTYCPNGLNKDGCIRQ